MGSRAPPAFAPWKLTTHDRSLAVAVGNELKRLGVRPDGLCRIGVSRPSVNTLADTVFTRVFSRMKQYLFSDPAVADVISTPTSIGFENFKLDDPPVNMQGLDGLPDLLMKYIQLWKNCEPPGPGESNTSAMLVDIQLGVAMLERKLLEKPEAMIKAQADRGSPEAALDYGLRCARCLYSRPPSHSPCLGFTSVSSVNATAPLLDHMLSKPSPRPTHPTT